MPGLGGGTTTTSRGGSVNSGVKCPSGYIGTYPNCSPKPAGAAIGGCPSGQQAFPKQEIAGSGGRRALGCPPGSQPNAMGQCCGSAAAAAGGAGAGGATFSMPGLPGAGAGAGGTQTTWTPSAVPRPELTPIDPQAAYDPELQNQLGRQRGFTDDLKAGTGFAMDVLAGGQRDIQNAQLREAEQAAAAAGIPFDRARFIMEQQKGLHGAMAQEKLGREQMVGQAIGAESGVAGTMAGERTERLGLDLKRDTVENELALDRYGRDIQKYGIDAQAATAANSALMDFYSRLTSGMFGMMGSLGGGGSNLSTSYRYG